MSGCVGFINRQCSHIRMWFIDSRMYLRLVWFVLKLRFCDIRIWIHRACVKNIFINGTWTAWINYAYVNDCWMIHKKYFLKRMKANVKCKKNVRIFVVRLGYLLNFDVRQILPNKSKKFNLFVAFSTIKLLHHSCIKYQRSIRK